MCVSPVSDSGMLLVVLNTCSQAAGESWGLQLLILSLVGSMMALRDMIVTTAFTHLCRTEILIYQIGHRRVWDTLHVLMLSTAFLLHLFL